MYRLRRASSSIPRMRTALVFAALAILALMAGCTTTFSSAPTPSVYEQLGGEPVVRKFVEDFTYLMATDDRVAEIFAFTDWAKFRPVMHDFLCEVAGGGCTYHGPDMVSAHRGIGITHGEFNVSVENMQKAMTKNDIPLSAQNRLLALLAPMRGDIVHR